MKTLLEKRQELDKAKIELCNRLGIVCKKVDGLLNICIDIQDKELPELAEVIYNLEKLLNRR